MSHEIQRKLGIPFHLGDLIGRGEIEKGISFFILIIRYGYLYELSILYLILSSLLYHILIVSKIPISYISKGNGIILWIFFL